MRMVRPIDLEGILLLEGIPRPLIAKFADACAMQTYGEGAVIFEEGSEAREFYMLKEGKVLLEVEIAPDIIISLGSIKKGYSFGWSALVKDGTHTTFAVAAEPCSVISIPGGKFLEILESDPKVGYLVMTRIFQIFRRRLERRTRQFIKVMRKHPDIQKLVEL
jgi:CRP/FNR family cyclic AMP-dependent transcriptional regulator